MSYELTQYGIRIQWDDDNVEFLRCQDYADAAHRVESLPGMDVRIVKRQQTISNAPWERAT